MLLGVALTYGASRAAEFAGGLIQATAPFSDSGCIFASGYETTFHTHKEREVRVFVRTFCILFTGIVPTTYVAAYRTF